MFVYCSVTMKLANTLAFGNIRFVVKFNRFSRAISASTHTTTSILLVDAPGFQNPATCGRQTGTLFEDLCHNYLQERLQLLFHHTDLVAPKDR